MLANKLKITGSDKIGNGVFSHMARPNPLRTQKCSETQSFGLGLRDSLNR